MQDIILIQLDFKTSAHTMQLHRNEKMNHTEQKSGLMVSIVGHQGKFGQHFPQNRNTGSR
jgi:hypothetical protein